MIAIDTNLLIYAHRAGVPQHKAAYAAVVEAASSPQGWGICLPSIAEFWSIVTHPSVPGGPSSSSSATSFIHRLLTDGHGDIWSPGPGFGQRLLRWAASLKLRGKGVFDLQIALIALEHGAREIWTQDRNFIALPGLRVHQPL